MEKTFETKESQELRLWYVETAIYNDRDTGYRIRRFQVCPHDWYGNSGSEELEKFFATCDEEGNFPLKPLLNNTGFSRVHLARHVPTEQLTLAEAIYGEAWLQRGQEQEQIGKGRFYRDWKKGRGKIIHIAYAPFRGPRDDWKWYQNLYTDIDQAARTFSYHDFLHVLGRESPIREEQIRRYSIPLEVGVKNDI